jgi:hypothetical protein
MRKLVLVLVAVLAVAVASGQKRVRPPFIEQKFQEFNAEFASTLRGTGPEVLGWGFGSSPSGASLEWFAWKDRLQVVWFALHPALGSGAVAVLRNQRDQAGCRWDVAEHIGRDETVVQVTSLLAVQYVQGGRAQLVAALKQFRVAGFRAMNLREVLTR